MFTTIIVDRVGNTNVFNIIRNEVGQQVISENNSLLSITDDDLIQEYLKELINIAQISRSIATTGEQDLSAFRHMDVKRRLHQIGETFYRQFFPAALQDYFRDKSDEYIYFHIDPALASIPLEILSNGKHFLWEKFYIGKSIKGSQTSSMEYIAKDKLSMLIIADPTEDLEWARREGEELFEHLNINFPEKKLQLELISGKHITKLSLLNDIVGKDIIHYSGHLHYTNDTQENGWLLYDKKIIHAREIQKSGAAPLLIFSNSCVSGRHLESIENKTSWYENFASSFIKSGKTNYIGTIWELPDTHQTLKFSLEFFDNIFQGYPVGYSLYKARNFAKENFGFFDLTWASYLLMGNPLSKLFQKESKVPDLSRSTLDTDMVLMKYPFPIAAAYSGIITLNGTEKSNHSVKFEKLYNAYEDTLLFVSTLIFANYEFLNINKPIVFDLND
ncbi:MAG: CHAT domain-containing protein, partial [Spirochaetia bacterium]|nr:CHAT domain-containing protein [Spirochaetia bacterium]